MPDLGVIGCNADPPRIKTKLVVFNIKIKSVLNFCEGFRTESRDKSESNEIQLKRPGNLGISAACSPGSESWIQNVAVDYFIPPRHPAQTA
jgi:hypothetical protein